jgi:hypothetical protein
VLPALCERLHLAGAPKRGLLFFPAGVRLSSPTYPSPQPISAPFFWRFGVLLFWLADGLPCGQLFARLSEPLFGPVSLPTFSQIFWLSWPSNPP